MIGTLALCAGLPTTAVNILPSGDARALGAGLLTPPEARTEGLPDWE
jgi:hypothetical protein